MAYTGPAKDSRQREANESTRTPRAARAPRATTGAAPSGMADAYPIPKVSKGFGSFHAPLAHIAEGAMLNAENPWLQQRADALGEDFKRTALPGISRDAEAAGRYGSNAQGVAQGVATTGLTNAIGNMRYQDYEARMGDMMQALGLGTQRDIAKYGTDAQSAAASASAGAAAAAAAAENDYRMKALQQSGELEALGMLGQLTGFQQGGMEQALGMLPGLDAMSGFGAYGDLFGASGDLANMEMNQDQFGRDLGFRNRQLQANTNIANRGLGLEAARDQYGREMDAFSWANNQPLAEIGAYGDIVSGMTSPYGSSSTQGMGTRQQGPSSGQGAIAGALGGMQIGGQIAKMLPTKYPGYDPMYGNG